MMLKYSLVEDWGLCISQMLREMKEAIDEMLEAFKRGFISFSKKTHYFC